MSVQPIQKLSRLSILLVLIVGLLSVYGVAAQSSEPIYIGVSGPLTGPAAQYGEQWKKGFDLALEEINAAGGIDGRELAYIFEDSQADPKQSVVVAQKFVADERIIVELGDFSSTASMAATPIYQRGGLVQFAGAGGFRGDHARPEEAGDLPDQQRLGQGDG